MILQIWSEYDSTTGLFTGRSWQAFDSREYDECLKFNISPGCSAIPGVRRDHLSEKVDVSKEVRNEHGALVTHGPVVSYQPPQPSEDHEWHTDIKRWQLKPEAHARLQRQQDAKARILALEQKKLRPLGELAVNPNSVEARKRVADIEAQLTELRKYLA